MFGLGRGPFWIDAGAGVRLATMARPFGGEKLENELRRIKAGGVDVIVSLLEPLEEIVLELQREDAACAALGLELLRFPVRDHDVPQSPDAACAVAREISIATKRSRSTAMPASGAHPCSPRR
jgi:hypothetical protein